MSGGKHTPGPWQVDGSKQQGLTIRSAAGAIAVVPGYGTGQRMANAKLIAAAPDLLAALNAMLTHMGMDEDEWNKVTFDQAHAAIAKATGEAA